MTPISLFGRIADLGMGQDEKKEAAPLLSAQRLELLRRFEVTRERFHFEPGALVMERDGMSIFRAPYQSDFALMFWAMLDFNNLSDRRLVDAWYRDSQGAGRVNCLVAKADAKGGSPHFLLHHTQHLRPLTDAERAEVEALLACEPAQSEHEATTPPVPVEPVS